MKMPKQRTVVIVAAVVVGGSLLYWLANSLILSEVWQLDAKAKQAEAHILQLEKDLAQEPAVARQLAEFQQQTFGWEPSDVSNGLLRRLTGLLGPSGLGSERFSSTPANGGAIRPKGKDREVGWAINVKAGKLANVINFLYLLAEEPHLHRVEFFTLKRTPGDWGKVDLNLKYVTLALEPPKGGAPASRTASAPTTETVVQLASLDSSDRDYLRIIEDRDVLRPYVKRPPPEPTPAPTPSPTPQPTPTPGPRPPPENPDSQWRVAGMPMVDGTEMVHLQHTRSREFKTLKIGETMAGGGKIVLIDGRPMPRRDNPREFSLVRVVLRFEGTYWAVELGDVLTQKHRLTPAELPDALRPPASAPAQGALSRGENGK